MRIRASGAVRVVVLCLAVLGATQIACAGGHIPPSTFQFTNIVPHTGPERGGWKVAQVTVLLSRISRIFPQNAVCEIEVGVPEVNRNGPVLDAFAQVEAAKAADKAARLVFRERLPTVLLCDQFKKQMERLLTDPTLGTIPGAKVTGFREMGVPRKTFP
jgi:hypothetical protein